MAVRSAIDAVREWLTTDSPEGLRLGSPRTSGNLTVVPTFHDGSAVEYQIFADAQLGKAVEITEVDQQGSVPDLAVKNSGEIPVLLVDGEILIGLKQNRVLNTTILIPPRTTLKVPVTCVEAGRWQRATATAGRARYSLSAKIRAVKAASVARAARGRGAFAADQVAVWERIGARLKAHRVKSPTSAYSDIDAARGRAIELLLHRLAPVPDQSGVLACVAGEPLSLDVFDRAPTLTRLWEELVGSYASEALITEKRNGSFDLERVTGWIRTLPDGEVTSHPGVGLGETVLITGAHHGVTALVVDGVPVHLAAWPL